MDIRHLNWLIHALLLLLLTACSPGGPEPAAPAPPVKEVAGPNLLLITLDTARADRFGCYGYEKAATPNIDRLAVEGVLFQQAFTPVPLTVSSHATIFTGCYPPHHGVHTNDERLVDNENLCLAETLRDQGFRTAAFLGAEVLHRDSGVSQGFETYADDFSATDQFATAAYPERPAPEVVGPAISWLEQQGDRQFFLWVHLFDPHRPFQAPAGFVSRSSGDPYDAEITFSDHWIGELLTALQRLGLTRQTVVAFLSDHGEGMGDHGETAHGFFIYDSTLRVPLILSAPGLLPAGKSLDPLVRTVDLAPTLLDLLGVAVPEVMQGTSLRPLIDGVPETPRELYAETYYPATAFGWSPLLGLRTTSRKMILAPRPELFLLDKERGEAVNRYDERPNEAAHLLARLEEQQTELEREGVGASRLIDQRSREMLSSLGYLTGGAAPGKEDQVLADPKDKIEIVNRLEQAVEMMGRNRHADAVRILEALILEEPESGHVLSRLGESLLVTRNYKRAALIYRRLTRITPEDEIPLVNLGSLAVMDKEHEKAVEYFESALEINPNQVEALLNLGYLNHRVLFNRQQAKTYYRRFLEAAPSDRQAAQVRSLLEQL